MKNEPLKGVTVKEEKMGSFSKWEVEDAMRDLKRAEMHKQNPELMEQVGKLIKKEVKAISSLADIKAIKKQKIEEMDEEEED
jgi:hypothetical protein